MSYASIASHNIPAGDHGAKPDQSLADGHFAGETASHADVDHKINVLPAGEDPSHPHLEHHAPPHPEPMQIHHAPVPEPHVSASAPKPLPTPHKHDIHIPEPGQKYEKDHQKAEKKLKEDEKKVEKKVDDAVEAVEGGVEAVGEKAKEVGKSVEKTAKEVGKKAEVTVKEVGKKAEETAKEVKKQAKEVGKKAEAEIKKAKADLTPYWEKTQEVVLRPGTLGGLMGVVNVGLLSTLGYFAYTRKDQPWDRRIVGGAIAGTLALFSAEGYVTDSYLSTPEGKQEAERAKKEGSKFYKQSREVVLRPQVAGGLVGAVNVAILGTVGYFSYKNWNRPWDPRVVSAVTIGLMGLSGLEGYAGKEYQDKELPKRR